MSEIERQVRQLAELVRLDDAETDLGRALDQTARRPAARPLGSPAILVARVSGAR